MRISRCSSLVALALAAAAPASATDGHFLHGVGAINSAMGGAGVAAPRSLLGAFYLNPAGLTAFEGVRMEFGFELFKPSRTVSSGVQGLGAGSTESVSEFTPVPAMGLSLQLSDKLTVGLGGLGIGGFGVDYPASLTNPILAPQPNGFGAVYSTYGLLKITPAAAYRVSDRLSIGAALNVDQATLGVRPAPFAAPDGQYYPNASNVDGAFGFGFQVGVLYRVNDALSVGASYASPQWFGDFEWNVTNANPGGQYGFPRTIRFRLDVPAVYAAGVGFRPTDALQLAADVRYIAYESTEGFAKSGFNADGSVAGFGWENILVAALGAEYAVSPRLSLRAGYNYSDNPIPDALSMMNVPAPGVVQHHLTAGLGFQLTPRLAVDLAFYTALKNSIRGPILGGAGPIPNSYVESELSEHSVMIQFSVKP
jgi:long-chain fatty acid transport protein